MAIATHQPPRARAPRSPRNGRTRSSRSRLLPRQLRQYGASNARHSRRPLVVGALLAVVLLPSLVLAGGGVGAWGYYTTVAAELRPRLDTLTAYHPFQTSRIFSRDGTLLYEYVNEGRRDHAALKDVSPLLVDATVAIEDKNFWTNNGVDYAGILRSAFLNSQAGETVSGASTITQQFIKLVVLTPDEQKERYTRKLKEAILAQQLTQAYAKDQIMELYVNEVNYGNRLYGIQAASQGYFGINAKDLNLNQASLLAGIPQQPTRFALVEHDDNGVLRGVQLKPGWLNPSRPLPFGTTPPRARQIDVLRQMVAVGMIKEQAAREAVAQDLPIGGDQQLTEANEQRRRQAPHFVDYVVEQLENDPQLGPLLRNEGGLNITTTLDLRFQQVAQQGAREEVAKLVAQRGNLNNAAVVIEQPRTGQILAMVGSIDYDLTKPTTTPGEEGNVVDGQVNVATRERQPGSALKPFTYLAAMQTKKATPGSIFLDVDTRWPQMAGATRANINSCVPEGKFWYCPQNYDRKWHGPLRMREALANSLNIPALMAIDQVGVPQTISFLHRMGITGLQRNDYGVAVTLGGGEVKLLDLTTAYNTLANDGQYIAPVAVLKITDRNDAVVREAAPTPQPVADPRLVAMVRDWMSDNAARTPLFGANSALKLSRPAAAKTGTTNDYRDAWAMGFTPYVTVGVWAGNNNNERTNRIGGIGGAGPIWNRIMEDIFADPQLDAFLRNGNDELLEFPDLETYGLVQRPVCQIGGAFGRRSTEWFTAEMKPAQTSYSACMSTDVIKPNPDGGAVVVGASRSPSPSSSR